MNTPNISPTTLDAVLPVGPHDEKRVELLVDSLNRFAIGLGTLHIVAPRDTLAVLKNTLRISNEAFRGVEWHEDGVLVPEARFLDVGGGWVRQMIIKLAIAEHIGTEFYMTLDADVVATRTFSAKDLFMDGRAHCGVDHENKHSLWYEQSAKTLRIRPVRAGISHNVTPAILHRPTVLALIDHLRALARRKFWVANRKGQNAWRTYLATRRWTEYAMYYTFAEATGAFERFHFETARNLCTTMSSQLVSDGVTRRLGCERVFRRRRTSIFCRRAINRRSAV
ncbi:MAG: DUF6492 family protein [Polyangiales bacterium]